MAPAVRIRPWEVLRFGLVLAAFGAAVSWSYGHPELYRTLSPLEGWTADAGEWLLLRSGIEAERAGTVLSHPAGFAYNISHRCTGAVVVAFLVLGILALPLTRQARMRGLLLGVPSVLAANLVRLVSLFYVGVHQREAFDFVHLVVWEALMIAVILTVWVGCLAAGAGLGSPRAASSPLVSVAWHLARLAPRLWREPRPARRSSSSPW